jgi:hypothetical protein
LAPGVKTYTVAALGAVGNAAMLLQEYVRGLPLETVTSVTTVLILNAVLFTLAFWFRGLANQE